MPIRHRVEAGETTTRLSDQYGFFAKTIWLDSANDDLRQNRKDMNELMPGDMLTIPDKKVGEIEKSDGARHTFRRRGIPAKFRLQLKSAGQPLAHRRYRLEVDGQLLQGTTDHDGRFEQFIPAHSQRGQLCLDRGPRRKPFQIEIAFGHLQPIEELSGIKMRLLNLGFACGEPDSQSDSRFRAAVREFQLRYSLKPSGEADAATVEKLRAVHDR